MNPRDLLLLRLREHLVEPLAAHGFRFAASKLHLTRTIGDVRQRIEICSNRHNSEDDAELWTMWSVTSREYSRWYAATWGEATTYDLLADSADWHIPGWSRGPAAPRFRLRNSEQDAREMVELRDDILGPGTAWLERVSTWEGAAEARRAHGSSFGPASDFLMIAGQPERARAMLLEGIERYTRQPRSDFLGELPRLRARLARYFPGELMPAT